MTVKRAYTVTNVRFGTTACQSCALKAQCTTGPERRIARWEHEAVLEKVQQGLDHKGLDGCDALPDAKTAQGCD